MRKKKRAARAARTLDQLELRAVSSKQQLEIIAFTYTQVSNLNSAAVTPVQGYFTSPADCRMRTRRNNHKIYSPNYINVYFQNAFLKKH